jgi:hypothetical protein
VPPPARDGGGGRRVGWRWDFGWCVGVAPELPQGDDAGAFSEPSLPQILKIYNSGLILNNVGCMNLELNRWSREPHSYQRCP